MRRLIGASTRRFYGTLAAAEVWRRDVGAATLRAAPVDLSSPIPRPVLRAGRWMSGRWMSMRSGSIFPRLLCTALRDVDTARHGSARPATPLSRSPRAGGPPQRRPTPQNTSPSQRCRSIAAQFNTRQRPRRRPARPSSLGVRQFCSRSTTTLGLQRH